MRWLNKQTLRMIREQVWDIFVWVEVEAFNPFCEKDNWVELPALFMYIASKLCVFAAACYFTAAQRWNFFTCISITIFASFTLNWLVRLPFWLVVRSVQAVTGFFANLPEDARDYDERQAAKKAKKKKTKEHRRGFVLNHRLNDDDNADPLRGDILGPDGEFLFDLLIQESNSTSTDKRR